MVLITGGILLILPNISSAHTGSVKCDSTGVVFSYNANFSSTTLVTENVADVVTGNSITQSVFVPRRNSIIDTVTASNLGAIASPSLGGTPAGTKLIARANWSDNGRAGSIGPVTLVCPDYVPPTPPAPPVCPTDTANEGMSNGVLVCVRTNTVTNTVTVTVPVEVVKYVATSAPVTNYKCPKGTKKVGFKNNVLTCLKSKTKTITKFKIKYIKPWHPLPPKGVGGVAG